ncbi:hypothetical protein INR75_06610 [Zunongwangia sp. SCSIO 43204]|uniref:hypothetical protein n=1 Tax=Zunongwangia sp. SCSIO 43204 TaxID=2779359 RepID=UPI001CA8FC3B|nr:hypothetical protein [Zunongwangia sp. SCSIO 43204]UAB85680.1 hypothetical protein INR75_06610 [Zunongwangia sp. SCSIO 43204]
MKIVLKNADASGNFLKKVVVNTPIEVSQETIDILNIYGSTFTQSQTNEIDSVLTTLRNKSWYNKIKLLMPIHLGQNNSNPSADNSTTGVYHAQLLNIINNQQVGFYSGANRNGNIEPTLTFDKGIFVSNYETDQNYIPRLKTLNSLELDTSNFHAGVYFSMPVDKKYNSNILDIFPVIGGVRNWQAQIGGTGNVSSVNYTEVQEALILQNRDESNVGNEYTAFKDGVKLTGATYDPDVYTASKTGLELKVLAFNTEDAEGARVSLITYGEPLTDQESIEYSDLLTTLANVLG